MSGISYFCGITFAFMLKCQYLNAERDHTAAHLLSVYGRQHRHNSTAGVNAEVPLILVRRHYANIIFR